MKKIEKGSTNHLIIQTLVFIVVGIILWPILDLLYCAIITHSNFVYTPEEHIAKPILFGLVVSFVLWLFDRTPSKK